MFIKAPFLLPHGFLTDFGYRLGRRFVGLYWEPCGDESCYDDGQASACGLSDNWLFLVFKRRDDVAAWLTANGIHLGNSDERAQHWLVVDERTWEVFAAPCEEARMAVIQQDIPG
jgi:hypothetical protein